MTLTVAQINSALPKANSYKLFDQQGLFLLVTPKGQKWWRFKYRFQGKEKSISLGVFPTISLKDAREAREEKRRLVARGIDPSAQKQIQKLLREESQLNSFEAVAREWLSKQKSTWAASHYDKVHDRFERDLFPWIGSRPISDITPKEVLAVVNKVVERGSVETAHRGLQNCSQVFRYGVATGRVSSDVTRDLRGALPPVKGGHFAAITDPLKLGGLLRAIDGYSGSDVVKIGLKLVPILFQRPGELRTAEWVEFDLDKAIWSIPARRMKMKEDHIVPLPKQAVTLLRDLKLLTGRGLLLFPSVRSVKRPMSDNTFNAALRRLGYTKEQVTVHGFRATARTLLDEVLKVRVEYIEHQLSHRVKDVHGRAYNRTHHLKERTEAMQVWADYLDKTRKEIKSE